MPFTSTRQLYLDYWSEAIGNGASAPRKKYDAGQAWGLFSTDQRTEFVTARKRVLASQDKRRDATAAANTAEQAVTDARIQLNGNIQLVDWEGLINTEGLAADAYIALRAAQRRCIEAADPLYQIMQQRAGARGDSLLVANYAQTQWRAEQTALGPIQAQIDGHVQEVEHPPVPASPAQNGQASGVDAQVFKMRQSWLKPGSRARRSAKRKRHLRDGDMGLQSPNVAQWIGAWMMEGGGMSVAGVWAGVGKDNLVCDRMLRKDTYQAQGQWESTRWFEGDLRDVQKRVPNEIACHKAVHGVLSRYPYAGTVSGNKEYIGVPQVHYEVVDDQEMVCRMHMEWCPHTTLDQLIQRYQRAPPPPGAAAGVRTLIPETAIWYFFQSLAEVGLAMETSTTDSKKPIDRSWQQIVHNDIKPSNVFLSAPHKGRYIDYPKPMLGDFGIAFRTSENDPLNPLLFCSDWGTSGFMAPETQEYIDRETLDPVERFKLLAHSNVWSIAKVIHSLMTLDDTPRPMIWLGDSKATPDTNEELLGNNQGLAPRYSRELVDLVYRCLAWRPGDRPKFWDVLARIEECTDESGLNLAQGMMQAWNLLPAVRQKNQLTSFMPFQDRYKRNMARWQLPAVPRPP